MISLFSFNPLRAPFFRVSVINVRFKISVSIQELYQSSTEKEGLKDLSAYSLVEFIVLEDIMRYIAKYRIVVNKTQRENNGMTDDVRQLEATGKENGLKACIEDCLEHFFFIILSIHSESLNSEFASFNPLGNVLVIILSNSISSHFSSLTSFCILIQYIFSSPKCNVS